MVGWQYDVSQEGVRMQWLRGLGLFAIALSLSLFACRPPAPEQALPLATPTATPSARPERIRQPTPQVTPTPQVSIDRLMAHVEALNYERYTERDRKTTRDYAAQVLQASGWATQEQAFDTGVNLIAQRPDADPQSGKIIVAAHYDSIRGSPGADDNASAVAAALEVAQLLSDRSVGRTLQIVLFDKEEAGLVGSTAYVEQTENLRNVDGVIVLEMLGYACHTVGCQQQPPGFSIETPSKVGDFLAIVGDTEHRPLLDTFQRPESNFPQTLTLPVPVKGFLSPIFLLSDHTPFWYKNVGAVMVTDTAFLRNPHYHRRSDIPSTFDRDFFRGATQIVVDATLNLLERPSPLTTPRSTDA